MASHTGQRARGAAPRRETTPSRRGPLSFLRIFALLLSFTLLTAACGTSDSDADSAEAEGADSGSDAAATADGAYEVPEEFKRLTLVGASQGGVFYNFYVAVSQLFNQELGMQTSVQAGGTQSNALEMESGQIQAAVTSPVDLVEVSGEASAPTSPERIRTLWNAPKTSWHVIVAGDSDIESIADLAGRRVATGITGSIESSIFNVAAECAGLSEGEVSVQNIGKDEGIDAFTDGNIDAWTGLGGLPTGNFTAAFESPRGARLIALDDEVVDCLVDRFVYLTPADIPADVYPGQTEAVATIDQWFYAVVAEDLPEDLVYNMAKTLHENHEDLVAALPAAAVANAENTAKIPGFPLHPGTKRLLEELDLSGPALDF